MKIKVSKVFANFINETAKELNFKVTAKVVETNERNYAFFVGDVYDAYNYGDVNNKGNFKAIKLVYPEDYYACCRYLTTKELTKEFRRLQISTVAELKQMIKDLCEI